MGCKSHCIPWGLCLSDSAFDSNLRSQLALQFAGQGKKVDPCISATRDEGRRAMSDSPPPSEGLSFEIL